jgi:3-hydroxyisobutyrate dehydrogenase-like beta-hydroxyacid dehydrogenase
MGVYVLIVSSSVKMVNQLLAGVHIASAAEAIAFAARLNLRTRRVFEIIQHSRGYSWYISLIISLVTVTSQSFCFKLGFLLIMLVD